MKIFGDVTVKEKSASLEIGEMENILKVNKNKWPVSRVSKGYICLVYEWYAIGMEEEGNRLLLEINKICPDYFKKHFQKHIDSDKNFSNLVIKLFIEFAFLLTHRPQSINIVVKK